MAQPLPFHVDPNDPRAPTEAQWAAMTPEERKRVVAALPNEVPLELFMPEGDPHRLAKARAIGALDAFFKKIGRKGYLSSELAVYYPGEPRFAPDVLAVVDVEPHERMRWVVSDEGKGLDVVLEVHVSDEWEKDFEANRKRYARLGIPEYFLFDRTRDRLFGWRLTTASARVYEVMVPQLGRLTSQVLGLDLAMDRDRLRFYFGTAPLPEAEELVARLEIMVGELVERRERAEQEQEQARREREDERRERERAEKERESERREREAAQRRVAELEAELAKLRDKR